MPPTGKPTAPESARFKNAPKVAPPEPLRALAILVCAAEPRRVAEVALLQGPGPWIVGRDDDENPERFAPHSPRAPFDATGAPPLIDEKLSRSALVIEDAEGGALAVRRTGRLPMFVNEKETETALVSEGDVLRVGEHLALLVTSRTHDLGCAARIKGYPEHAHGEPDAYGIVGESPAVANVRADLLFAAEAERHVLILGPTGTGKELAAHAIHALSSRGHKPLVSFSAATVPHELAAALLFGNRKNFPNPGMPERKGLVGEADGRILFIDEIGRLDPAGQAALLRVTDPNGEYLRLGEDVPRRADVVVVAATNVDPEDLEHDIVDRFKVQIELPSLEDRPEDIPLLVRHLVLLAAKATPKIAGRFVYEHEGRKEVRLAPEIVCGLVRRAYPRNVRELDKILVEAMSKSPGDTILPTRKTTAPGSVKKPRSGGAQLQAVLDRHGWHITNAAKELGMSRASLRRRIAEHGLGPAKEEESGRDSKRRK
jgi:two-component system nitrogen regulation response regulator GlnG/two-component system response regulator HydG